MRKGIPMEEKTTFIEIPNKSFDLVREIIGGTAIIVSESEGFRVLEVLESQANLIISSGVPFRPAI